MVLDDSNWGSTHAVAISDDLYCSRVILERELPDALPFSQEALELCCGADLTIIRLAEVVLVQAVGRRAHDVN